MCKRLVRFGSAGSNHVGKAGRGGEDRGVLWGFLASSFILMPHGAGWLFGIGSNLVI